MWTQDMFGVEKPIIALLHLDALPGDPGYCGDMKTVTEHARKDLSCTKRRSGCCKIHYVRRFCRWIMCVGSGSRSRTGRCDTIQSA